MTTLQSIDPDLLKVFIFLIAALTIDGVAHLVVRLVKQEFNFRKTRQRIKESDKVLKAIQNADKEMQFIYGENIHPIEHLPENVKQFNSKYLGYDSYHKKPPVIIYPGQDSSKRSKHGKRN